MTATWGDVLAHQQGVYYTAPILPLFFTVEGHESDEFSGPVADTATQLESEGLCHHLPTSYNSAAIPFNNASGVTELARRVGQRVQDNGVPFPAGTPFVIGGFSQGMIVVFDFLNTYMQDGQPLAWRRPDLKGVLMYGDPCRKLNSIAPWAVGGITTQNTHGLDPYKRFGLPGCIDLDALGIPYADVYREGDIFAENTDDLKGQLKASIYQAVARGDVVSLSGTSTGDLAAILVGQLVSVTSANYLELLAFAIGVIEAIISGLSFLAGDPNPHYSPFDETGGIEWARQILLAA